MYFPKDTMFLGHPSLYCQDSYGRSASRWPPTLGHEVKRPLLLGRKATTNLDSILKSRDLPLPTNVHLVKAMVFPVVMYGCESWTIKKIEHQRLMLLNCGVGEDS